MAASDDDEVFEHLTGLIHQFKTHMRRSLQDGEQGLAPMEARALGFFARHPSSTATQLAQHAGRDKAQVTRLIRELLERGFLESAPDEDDRRSHRMRLTERGREVQTVLRRQRKALARRMLSDFSAEERAQLSNLLRRMRANADPLGAAD